MDDFTITSVEAFPVSVALPAPVRMGLGYALKREAVVVKVTTAGGLIGYGEAHHSRAPEAVATIVNTVVRDLSVGSDAREAVRIWNHVYRNHIMTHGTGSAAVCALSGLDMALWDIRAKAVDWPLYRLLGGQAKKPIPAYAGGVSLGYGAPADLVADVGELVASGFTAVKVRIGESPTADLARVRAVREAFPAIGIFTDANARYVLSDVARVAPVLEELGVGWLEEPFGPDGRHAYAQAHRLTRVPLAAGENHFTRYEFAQLIEEGAVTVLQPDVSKCGGVMELIRIAGIASAANIQISPHTSVTGINMAATVHLLTSIDNGGWFEADAAKGNGLRTELCSASFTVGPDGNVTPLEAPGIGVEVDEEYLRAHPPTPGPAFVRSL